MWNKKVWYNYSMLVGLEQSKDLFPWQMIPGYQICKFWGDLSTTRLMILSTVMVVLARSKQTQHRATTNIRQNKQKMPLLTWYVGKVHVYCVLHIIVDTVYWEGFNS